MRTPTFDDDSGSVTLWLITSAWVMILLVGMVVDLSGQVHAQQRARDVAAQAARSAGQQLNAPQAIRGVAARANAAHAVAAARSYLDAAGVEGSARVEDGTTLVVTASDTYPTKFLSIIGLTTLRVHGSASARIVRAVGGVEQ